MSTKMGLVFIYILQFLRLGSFLLPWQCCAFSPLPLLVYSSTSSTILNNTSAIMLIQIKRALCNVHVLLTCEIVYIWNKSQQKQEQLLPYVCKGFGVRGVKTG